MKACRLDNWGHWQGEWNCPDPDCENPACPYRKKVERDLSAVSTSQRYADMAAWWRWYETSPEEKQRLRDELEASSGRHLVILN